MLDLIRNNSQSLGVKLAFGLIIVVFVFWGLGSVQSINNSSTLATVNGEAISVIDFEQAFQQARESVRAQNPQITEEQMKQMQLPQQVMQQLITEALLGEEMKRIQWNVSPKLLRDTILAMPAFHDKDGKFDSALYKQIVDARFVGAGNFESMVGQQLAEGALREDLTLTAQKFSSETTAFFGYTYEQRDVDYVFFPAADYLASVESPAEDSVKAYYESHRQEFTLPAKVDVSFIRVYPLDLGKPESFSAEAVKAYYDSHQDDYSKPKKFKARHILLTVSENAPEAEVQQATEKLQGILTEIKNGADFAAMASEYSQDTMSQKDGGNLDWVAAGDTVPAFNDVLVSMQPGDVSEIVRTTFGVHIIKVEDVQEAGLEPLADVEKFIRDDLARDAGHAKIREVLDTLIEANVLGKDLEAAAKQAGLSLEQSGLKNTAELQDALFLTPENTAKFFAMAENVPLDTAVETANGGYIVGKIAKKQEASVRPFDEVKNQIISILTEQAALQKALEAAAEARKGYDKAAPEASSVQQIKDVMRGQSIGKLGNVPEMGVALFAAPVNEWLPIAYSVDMEGAKGAALVRVTRVGVASADAWEPMEEILSTALVNQRRDKMFQLFLFELSEKAEINIVNEGYLNTLMAQ